MQIVLLYGLGHVNDTPACPPRISQICYVNNNVYMLRGTRSLWSFKSSWEIDYYCLVVATARGSWIFFIKLNGPLVNMIIFRHICVLVNAQHMN